MVNIFLVLVLLTNQFSMAHSIMVIQITIIRLPWMISRPKTRLSKRQRSFVVTRSLYVFSVKIFYRGCIDFFILCNTSFQPEFSAMLCNWSSPMRLELLFVAAYTQATSSTLLHLCPMKVKQFNCISYRLKKLQKRSDCTKTKQNWQLKT